jgi:hypothetical protein
MNLVIFSNTDYFYLWPIIEENIIKLNQLNPIFVCNKTDLKKPIGFIKYIEYDDKLCYSERWTKNILSNIYEEYILIVHDVNIIVNCDDKYIYKIIQIMIEQYIDRCSLNVFNGIDIIENYGVKLCELNTAVGNTITPYDVCPAIWRTKSFKKLFENFPNETYRNSELNKNLQTFCKDNLRCFGLQKTSNEIKYCLGRPYYEEFKILHITIKNELTFPIETYMDMKEEFLYLFEKYKLGEKIKINNSYNFILENFRKI